MSQKVIVCDMDGTLIKEEVANSNGEILPTRWNLIMDYLGDEACQREKEAKQDWYDGAYKEHPDHFLRDVIEIFSDEGLKKDYFEEVIGSYEYFPGVERVLEESHKRGYKTAMVSGGFMALAEKVSNELDIDYTRAACKLEWDYQGNLAGWNLLQEDYGSKVASLEEILSECDAELSNCVYVGNGYNDVSVAEYVVENGGIAVAFNGPSKLKEVCTYSVDGEDFYEVLKYLL